MVSKNHDLHPTDLKVWQVSKNVFHWKA